MYKTPRQTDVHDYSANNWYMDTNHNLSCQFSQSRYIESAPGATDFKQTQTQTTRISYFRSSAEPGTWQRSAHIY